MTITFGAMAPSLKKQLGSSCPQMFQDSADAITRLTVHGLLTHSEAGKARLRLIRLIEKDAREKGLLK